MCQKGQDEGLLTKTGIYETDLPGQGKNVYPGCK
jgi:hypothetical protein